MPQMAERQDTPLLPFPIAPRAHPELDRSVLAHLSRPAIPLLAACLAVLGSTSADNRSRHPRPPLLYINGRIFDEQVAARRRRVQERRVESSRVGGLRKVLEQERERERDRGGRTRTLLNNHMGESIWRIV
jgi:hypothetical protein